MVDFISACNEFGHKWIARYVAKLVSNGKVVGTVAMGVSGYSICCFPHPMKIGMSLDQVRDIMRDVQNGVKLS